MEAWRWLEKDGVEVEINGGNVLLTCTLDENHNHVISENAIKTLNIKEGDTYTLVYAEPLDGDPKNGFMKEMVKWNVVFDGEKFISDVNNPDIEFIEIID